MINFNGSLIDYDNINYLAENRAFKYGDGVFETIKVHNGKPCFVEDHYFRLMSSLRILRMEIPMYFTYEYFSEQLIKTIESKDKVTRIRFAVYRKNGGLYLPTDNNIDYIVEAFSVGQYITKERYEVELYTDNYINSGILSTIKSTNRILNIVANIYIEENGYDNGLLVNENKNIVEAINSNIFIVKGTSIITPPVSDGCIKGIARKNIINLLTKDAKYSIEERSISPFELKKADEIFLTNTIMGIQPITNYRKKEYKTEVSMEVSRKYNIFL